MQSFVRLFRLRYFHFVNMKLNALHLQSDDIIAAVVSLRWKWWVHFFFSYPRIYCKNIWLSMLPNILCIDSPSHLTYISSSAFALRGKYFEKFSNIIIIFKEAAKCARNINLWITYELFVCPCDRITNLYYLFLLILTNLSVRISRKCKRNRRNKTQILIPRLSRDEDEPFRWRKWTTVTKPNDFFWRANFFHFFRLPQ